MVYPEGMPSAWSGKPIDIKGLWVVVRATGLVKVMVNRIKNPMTTNKKPNQLPRPKTNDYFYLNRQPGPMTQT